MKTCTKCHIQKDLIDFSVDKQRKSGFRPNCKECASKYHFKNKERNNKRSIEDYYRNREKRIQYSKKYYNDPKNDAVKTNGRLLRTYGISLTDYERMFTYQDGKCAICDKDRRNLKKKLYVDHDHKTSKVRGLLCDQCNRGLGYFKENKDFLSKAIKYLEKSNE